MGQQFVVACIVLLAALYAAWYWMPRGLRRRLGGYVRHRAGAASSAPAGARRLAEVLERSPGCASCESCGGCGSPGQPPIASEAGQEGDAQTRPITIFPHRR